MSEIPDWALDLAMVETEIVEAESQRAAINLELMKLQRERSVILQRRLEWEDELLARARSVSCG